MSVSSIGSSVSSNKRFIDRASDQMKDSSKGHVIKCLIDRLSHQIKVVYKTFIWSDALSMIRSFDGMSCRWNVHLMRCPVDETFISWDTLSRNVHLIKDPLDKTIYRWIGLPCWHLIDIMLLLFSSFIVFNDEDYRQCPIFKLITYNNRRSKFRQNMYVLRAMPGCRILTVGFTIARPLLIYNYCRQVICLPLHPISLLNCHHSALQPNYVSHKTLPEIFQNRLDYGEWTEYKDANLFA